MKHLLPLCLFFLATPSSVVSQLPPEQQVNAILGDISYVEKFGRQPTLSTSEKERISVHLAYVENLLKSKDVAHLPANLQTRRKEMLLHLHKYRLAAKFPTNKAYPGQRRPCFIDGNGNICAVGHLVEQSAGRELAEAINQKFQYRYLLDMDMPELSDWVANSGLTAEECAMIQPGYGHSVSCTQGFDGNDTLPDSIAIRIKSTPNNTWQIGQPSKAGFDSAFSQPNVIVTGLSDSYPASNESVFEFKLDDVQDADILYLNWTHRLDMPICGDMGFVEYSVDGGPWGNAIDSSNCAWSEIDSTNFCLTTRGMACNGMNSGWSGVNLCYSMKQLSINDSITFRFTFISDAKSDSMGGWMIDDLIATFYDMPDWQHWPFPGVPELNGENLLRIVPNPTTGIIQIAEKENSGHLISRYELINIEGRTVEEYHTRNSSTLDISGHPDGVYFLKAWTDNGFSTSKVVLQK